MTKFESLLTRNGLDPLTAKGLLILQATKLAFESRLTLLNKKRISIVNRINDLDDLSPYNDGSLFDLENWDNKRIKLQEDLDKLFLDRDRLDALYIDYFLEEVTTTTSTTGEPTTTTSSTTEEPITTTTSTSEEPGTTTSTTTGVLSTTTSTTAAPTTTSTTTGPGTDTMTFTAMLSGASEVPPNASGASGNALLLYNDVTDRFTLQVDYFPMALTGAHIHRGPVGADGPIVFALDHTTNPISYMSPPLSEIEEYDLKAGFYYINLHTTAYPDGEIRGQVL